jgi:hypothetical protein
MMEISKLQWNEKESILYCTTEIKHCRIKCLFCLYFILMLDSYQEEEGWDPIDRKAEIPLTDLTPILCLCQTRTLISISIQCMSWSFPFLC